MLFIPNTNYNVEQKKYILISMWHLTSIHTTVITGTPKHYYVTLQMEFNKNLLDAFFSYTFPLPCFSHSMAYTCNPTLKCPALSYLCGWCSMFINQFRLNKCHTLYDLLVWDGYGRWTHTHSKKNRKKVQCYNVNIRNVHVKVLPQVRYAYFKVIRKTTVLFKFIYHTMPY